MIAVRREQEMSAFWKKQIELCDKETRRWRKRGEKICQKYRDERGSVDEVPADSNKKSLNLFWSNVQLLKPAIYSKTPVPICERRFLDKDTTGRVASTILERALRYEVAMCGFDSAMRRARDDYLLPGRGQVWVRYNPKFGEPISTKQVSNDEITFEGSQSDQPEDLDAVEEVAAQEQKVISETLCTDYLHWQDYYTFPPKARTEDEIEGKGRRLFMSQQDLIERFGNEVGKKVPLDHSPESEVGGKEARSSSTNVGQEGNQATVFEIWWKPERKIYFVAKEYDECLVPEGMEADEDGGITDPLRLEGFFPCPKPIVATTTNDTLIPVPDYAEAQDQYMQIDDLTKRIDVLTNACKIRGVYDAAAQGVKRVFEEGTEPDLIPIDSWVMFAEKGGLKGAIDWVPLKDIADCLKILIEVRKQIMEDLDHVTGISDINRGTSDARETLGGVKLKQNATSGRLQERQDDFARFARDTICIMGEIISEQYDPQTLIQVSGALYDEGLDPPDLPPAGMMPPQPIAAGPAGPPPMAGPAVSPPETPEMKEQRKLAMIGEAIQLLRNDKLRGFRIDIETDSTVSMDAEKEKQSRVEFVEGVTKFVQVAGEVTMQLPEFAPLAAKMLQFAVRGFRVGRDLESAIEDFAEKAEKQAKDMANKPPKPDPEQIKQETEKIKQAGEIQTQQVEAQSEQRNAEIRMAEEQTKAQNAAQDREFEMRKMAMEEQFAMAAHNRKMAELQMTAELAEKQHAHAIEIAEHKKKEAMKPKEAA